MRRIAFSLLVFFLFFLTGCSEEKEEASKTTLCGDGICDATEIKKGLCQEDCLNSKENVSPDIDDASPQKTSAGGSFVTHIPSDDIGNIAVKATLPEKPRYEEGAPVVVYVSTFFTAEEPGFDTDFTDITSLGFVHVTYLWPGRSDTSGAESEGTYDYGGKYSLKALSDVIKFASGEIPDIDGNYISDLSEVVPLTNNVGLYAFSHPGIAATNVLALYGDKLSVDYFVGRENPTVPALSAVELGRFDGNIPILNPFYTYPDDYSSSGVALDYSSIFWDDENDVPYFDVNGNKEPDSTDFVLGKQTPSMYGKRMYSAELLQSLVDNSALSLDKWPDDLATPSDAEELWDFRDTSESYKKLAVKIPELKVMLVFAEKDHVQPLKDKPHIHQAYDGFTSAGLWIRLNPDASYVSSISSVASFGSAAVSFSTDNDANAEPADWNDIEDWAYPNKKSSTKIVPLAAVAEMADRVYTNNLDENLDGVLARY